MLSPCVTPGCNTLTMGGTCVEHDPPQKIPCSTTPAMMDDARVKALGAIGLKGAMPASLLQRGVDLPVVSDLLDGGYVTEHRIDHHGDPNAEPVVVTMLTETGAAAIGEDPDRIGLA